MKKLLIFLILIFSATVTSTFAQDAKVEQGKKLVQLKRCALCHRKNGLGHPMENLAKGKTVDFLKKAILDPKKTIGPDTKMPPFKLNDEELDAMIAYLQSLSKQ